MLPWHRPRVCLNLYRLRMCPRFRDCLVWVTGCMWTHLHRARKVRVWTRHRPTSSMMSDPLPQTEFDLPQSQQAPTDRHMLQVPMSTPEVSPSVPEPLQDIVQPVPDAIPQTQFDLPQFQQAPTNRQVPQAAMAQQQDPQPAAAAQSTDGTEPVDHKDPEVVQHFQHYFGVAMTFQQVMELFDKGGAVVHVNHFHRTRSPMSSFYAASVPLICVWLLDILMGAHLR